MDIIFDNDTNKKIFEKYLSSYQEPIKQEIIYELGYLIHVEKKTIKQTLELLKSNKINKNHENFNKIKQRIEETDKYLDKPFEATEGCEKCNKCGSMRTISYSKQLRSGDESAHVFIFCVDCKSRYTINS